MSIGSFFDRFRGDRTTYAQPVETKEGEWALPPPEPIYSDSWRATMGLDDPQRQGINRFMAKAAVAMVVGAAAIALHLPLAGLAALGGLAWFSRKAQTGAGENQTIAPAGQDTKTGVVQTALAAAKPVIAKLSTTKPSMG